MLRACQRELMCAAANLPCTNCVETSSAAWSHCCGCRLPMPHVLCPAALCCVVCRPFLLQSKLSMTQMGLFSISGYPYSFKLLWSPIVDSVYSAGFGRRKSWIVPVQLISAALLMFSADWIQTQYEAGAVAPLTVLFFFFVLLAATQVSWLSPPVVQAGVGWCVPVGFVLCWRQAHMGQAVTRLCECVSVSSCVCHSAHALQPPAASSL